MTPAREQRVQRLGPPYYLGAIGDVVQNDEYLVESLEAPFFRELRNGVLARDYSP